MNKNERNFRGRDALTRMNFLYQASVLMAGTNNVLSSYYGVLCKSISKKGVFRMEPDIKRTMCKQCGISLKPEITAKISIYLDNFRLTCGQCGCVMTFIQNANYNLWIDNQKSIVSTFGLTKTNYKQNSINVTIL